MKSIVLLTFLLSVPLIGNADLYLNEGETFTWSFEQSDFAYNRDRESPAFSMYTAWSIDLEPVFDPQIFKFITPIFKVSTYENNVTESSITEAIYTNTFGLAAVHSSSNIMWEDRQGVFQIEVIQGPFIVKALDVTTITNNEYHIASIPEPNSVALLLVGSGIFYLRRKKYSQPEIRAYSVERRFLRPNLNSGVAHF